jgi:hypothetical protein
LAAHVFISYVHQNRDLVDRLATELRNSGVTVWLDRNDIEPGARWRDAIEKAIHSGKFFIACFSREYSERDQTHMNEELMLAIDEIESKTLGNDLVYSDTNQRNFRSIEAN